MIYYLIVSESVLMNVCAYVMAEGIVFIFKYFSLYLRIFSSLKFYNLFILIWFCTKNVIEIRNSVHKLENLLTK